MAIIRPALLLLLACSELTVNFLSFSTWGGIHIGLTITVGGARVEYDCAEGEILEPISPVDGRFSVQGIHRAGVGGPIGIDPATSPRPARYEGVVRGDRMTLTVTLTDKNERLGVFELRGGASPQVFKCL
ncbi:MAG TPA: hypothetical protein VGA78_12150 [Gemmatimonadales bacterium]|jgi:hypothetical protein